MKGGICKSDNLLVPGMYATVVSDAEIAKGSILVPTKALVQLLNRDMLDVVVDGKVQQKAVKLGATYGIYTIIESGIDENDEIIVEGQNKVRVGQAVAPKKPRARLWNRRRSRPLLCSMARQMLRNKGRSYGKFLY